MNNPEEPQVALIPRNFMERGTFMGGMFKIRNAIEGAVLAGGIAIPVVHLPLSLTARIIILCMTSLPAAMVSLIGIGGESLTAFLMNAIRFLKNRRIIYRSDVTPDYRKKRHNSRNREPKSQKRKKQKNNRCNENDTTRFKDSNGFYDEPQTTGSSFHFENTDTEDTLQGNRDKTGSYRNADKPDHSRKIPEARAPPIRSWSGNWNAGSMILPPARALKSRQRRISVY